MSRRALQVDKFMSLNHRLKWLIKIRRWKKRWELKFKRRRRCWKLVWLLHKPLLLNTYHKIAKPLRQKWSLVKYKLKFRHKLYLQELTLKKISLRELRKKLKIDLKKNNKLERKRWRSSSSASSLPIQVVAPILVELLVSLRLSKLLKQLEQLQVWNLNCQLTTSLCNRLVQWYQDLPSLSENRVNWTI